MTDNPWDVDSIEAFSFLKCPECIFDTKEEENFRDHAFENHPLSFVFFGKKLKEEPSEDITENNSDLVESYYDNTTSENSNLPEIYNDNTYLEPKPDVESLQKESLNYLKPFPCF